MEWEIHEICTYTNSDNQSEFDDDDDDDDLYEHKLHNNYDKVTYTTDISPLIYVADRYAASQ